MNWGVRHGHGVRREASLQDPVTSEVKKITPPPPLQCVWTNPSCTPSSEHKSSLSFLRVTIPSGLGKWSFDSTFSYLVCWASWYPTAWCSHLVYLSTILCMHFLSFMALPLHSFRLPGPLPATVLSHRVSFHWISLAASGESSASQPCFLRKNLIGWIQLSAEWAEGGESTVESHIAKGGWMTKPFSGNWG